MEVGFGMGFDTFGKLFTVMFALFLAVFAVTVVRGIRQWNRNNHSPRLTIPARIAAKRTCVSHHRGGPSGHHHVSTLYYVTFQMASGDRMELRVPGTEYGMLTEGDSGKVTFQGSRYLGFERT